jgi:hypothetical protein
MSRAVQGTSVKLMIYLLDNTPIEILVAQDVRVEAVILSALRQVGVRDACLKVLLGCFALCECLDGDSLCTPLGAYDYVLDAVASWRAREASLGLARLYLQLRLITPGVLGASSADPALQHLLFAATMDSYMREELPVSVESASQLAGVLLLIRHGCYDAARHRPGFCAAEVERVVPAELIPRRPVEVWDDLILSSFAKLGGAASPSVAKELFCSALEELELFGCTHFDARQRFNKALPAALTVCLSSEGVLLVDKTPERPILQRLPLKGIQLWSGLNASAVGPVGGAGAGGGGGGGVSGYFQLTLCSAPQSGPSRLWAGLLGPQQQQQQQQQQQVISFQCEKGGDAADLMNCYAEQLMKELVEEQKNLGQLKAAEATAAAEAAAAAAAAATAAAAAPMAPANLVSATALEGGTVSAVAGGTSNEPK